jgi:hypothetical protein
MPTQKQRQSVRKRRRLRVTIADSPAFTADVGTGGFCAEMMRVPRPGTTVKGTITFAGRDFEYVGLVRWARSGDARILLTGRMGVHFLQIPSEFLGLLVRDLAEH